MKFYVRLIMRINLICILLFSALLQVSASGLAQNISLSKKNITLQQLFLEIKAQSGYDFLYEPQMLYQANPVDINVSNVPLKNVLDQVFANQPLSFTVDQKTIVLKKKETSVLHIFLNFLKSVTVIGRVTDEKGVPLNGATIKIKGTPRLAKTDANGVFTFRNVPENSVLVFSYIGYTDQERTIKDNTAVTIVMKPMSSALDTVSIVVSTGYQQLNKDRSTGSFVQINNEQFNRKVGGTVMDRIYEITSGLMKVNKPQGFEVRGLSTINANKVPLIVLDDFPYPGDINSLNRLNPNDVESITVLKDAAAASIWGAQAGNGVIVITTKKGKYNKRPSVSFNSNVTVGAKPDIFSVPILSSADEIGFEEMRFNRGDYNTYDNNPTPSSFSNVLPQVAELLLAVRGGRMTQAQADTQIAAYQNNDVRNDINKYFLQNSVSQQYALNLSGGSANYFYAAAAGYDKNRSTTVGQMDDRLNLNFNNTYKILKNLEVNAFIDYTQSKKNTSNVFGTGLLPIGSGVTPYTMLADANGNALAIPHGYRSAFVDTARAPDLLDWHYRPLDELKYADNVQKIDQMRIGGGLKYTVIPGLTAEVKYQYLKELDDVRDLNSLDTYSTRNQINNLTSVDPVTHLPVHPIPLGGIMNLGNSEAINWNLRGTVNYNKRWGDHEIVAIAGSEIRQSTDESRNDIAYGYNADFYNISPIDPITNFPNRFGGTTRISDGKSIGGTIGRFGDYFANGAYTYKNKYTLSASGRIDESNYFGVKANQRIAPLWSSGLAWNLSKEDFYHVDWLPQLKLRATYGYNGNTNGGNAFPTATYAVGNIISPTLPYASITSPGNPELSWEKVKIVNLAVEAASKDDRISGSFEYYLKKGIDLIGPIVVDPTSGVLNFTGNNASIKGSGYDLTINTRNLTGAVKWNSQLLVSYNTDKVTSYDQVVTLTSSYLAEEIPVIGKPLDKITSYRWAGLNPKDGTPQLYLADTVSSYLNMAKAKPSDLVYSGPSVPRYFGSFLNSFSYKNFTLSFNLYFKFDYYFRRSSINYNNLYSGWGGHSDYDLRWQKPGDEKTTDVPSIPTSTFRTDNYLSSDLLVDRGDFIRLQDIRLSYDLLKSKFHALPFQSVQFYLYANNIGLLWRANKDGIDPDAAEYGAMSIPRTISAGVSVNF